MKTKLQNIFRDIAQRNQMQDLPNFAAWSNENLAKFAMEAYLRLQAQQDALEQLRGDLKDAMQLVRASTLPVND